MEWWKAPNWEGPERNALRDERRREHWWERQEDERYRLDWGDLVGEALELLLESPVFGLTLDVGHDFRAQGVDRLFMEWYSGRIVHPHDSDGQQDHLPLGEGQADLLGALELAERRNCRVVLEVKTADGLNRSLEWLCTHYKNKN